MKTHEALSLLIISTASLSPALSMARYFGDLSRSILNEAGLYVPPALLAFLVFFALSIYLHWVRKLSLPVTAVALAVFYVLPYLGGIPLSEVKLATLTAIPLSVVIPLVPYAHHLKIRNRSLNVGYPQGELESIPWTELEFIGVGMLPGALVLAAFLYLTDAGESPLGLFPIYGVLVFSLLIGLALSLIDEYEDHYERTVLVLRAHMKVGDTFTVSKGTVWENGFELKLDGGNPVERTVLIKVPVNNIPGYVVLSSPWEKKFLVKKRETVDGSTRYVLFLQSKSHAPSWRDNASAPR
ncbi:hypothetical protein [Thermococcus sp. Bubb.Bath]|uniref:hypothetical protein n=1 Tax=Thermococcus sp. Bubb.Bath TaxID=1638242 RepID=UPI0014389623|nr:hypothetical protein [Thermococcus sp. Bubb.Bath]NJF24907.1 hypothetical protein [Thermococcus sp. Bubb.Bath]